MRPLHRSWCRPRTRTTIARRTSTQRPRGVRKERGCYRDGLGVLRRGRVRAAEVCGLERMGTGICRSTDLHPPAPLEPTFGRQRGRVSSPRVRRRASTPSIPRSAQSEVPPSGPSGEDAEASASDTHSVSSGEGAGDEFGEEQQRRKVAWSGGRDPRAREGIKPRKFERKVDTRTPAATILGEFRRCRYDSVAWADIQAQLHLGGTPSDAHARTTTSVPEEEIRLPCSD